MNAQHPAERYSRNLLYAAPTDPLTKLEAERLEAEKDMIKPIGRELLRKRSEIWGDKVNPIYNQLGRA